MITVRLPSYVAIVRGVDTVLSAPVWASGALVAPTAATARVYDSNGALFATLAAVISGSIAQVTVLGSTTTGLALGVGWRVEWDLVIAGAVRTARTIAVLARSVLYPVVTDEDLYGVQPQLRPGSVGALTRETTYQGYLDEAWRQIEDRLLSAGRRPWLVLEPQALRSPHLYLTMALVFESLSIQSAGALGVMAEQYRREYEATWARVSMAYDRDDDGIADDHKVGAGSGSIFLCRPPPANKRWY